MKNFIWYLEDILCWWIMVPKTKEAPLACKRPLTCLLDASHSYHLMIQLVYIIVIFTLVYVPKTICRPKVHHIPIFTWSTMFSCIIYSLCVLWWVRPKGHSQNVSHDFIMPCPKSLYFKNAPTLGPCLLYNSYSNSPLLFWNMLIVHSPSLASHMTFCSQNESINFFNFNKRINVVSLEANEF
jgi:hypothetical protein